MSHRLFAVAASAVCLTVSAPALGASWTDFNVVVRDNLLSIGDIEGAALIGGNAAGNNIFGSVGTSPSGLTLGVGGDVIGNLNLNAGDARIGGTVTHNVNNNGGGSISLGDASISSVVTSAYQSAAAASSAFAALTANSATSAQPGNKLLFDAADNAQYAVFDIDASDLSSYQAFQLQRDGAGTIVVNVHGGASNIDVLATMNDFQSSADSIVWNFIDAAGNLDVQRQMEGSVLALDAYLRLSAVIEGSVVVRDGRMNGQEFHLPAFAGDIPPLVPLPSGGLMGIAGLTLVAGLRRRRA